MEIAQYSTRDHMMDVLVTNYKTLIDKCVLKFHPRDLDAS